MVGPLLIPLAYVRHCAVSPAAAPFAAVARGEAEPRDSPMRIEIDHERPQARVCGARCRGRDRRCIRRSRDASGERGDAATASQCEPPEGRTRSRDRSRPDERARSRTLFGERPRTGAVRGPRGTESRRRVRAGAEGRGNSPGSCEREALQALALAGVTPVRSVLERRRIDGAGLWRSGSASHWQCGGRGFESRQVHRRACTKYRSSQLRVVPRSASALRPQGQWP